MPKPGFNPNEPQHIQRLYRASDWSKAKLQPFREQNVRSISQLAGRFYGQNKDAKVPINLMELAYTIYLRHLAGGTPRVHCWSPYRNLRPYAADFELVMNDVLDRMEFAQTMRKAVGNALLGMSPVKVGVEAGENIENYSEKPFVDAIGLDNWVHDMTADVWPNVQFMGNGFSMPLEVAKETREFNKKQSDKLQPDEGGTYNQGGDAKASSLSVDSSKTEGRLHDVVPLEDYWLPLDRMLVTVDANHVLDKPLRVVEFDDEPESGPFEVLSFCELQGNTVPLPPSALWMDLHALSNNIFNKLENQAKNARNITTFSGAEGAAAAKLMDETGDGGACAVPPGAEPKPVKTTGVDQVSLAFLIQVIDLAKLLGGNLDALGGLGPQSPTLGQDQLLSASASQRLAEMSDCTHVFESKLIRTLSYYEHSGENERALKKPVRGTDIEVDVKWDRQRRKAMGPLAQYQVKLAVGSSWGTTPAMKLQGLVQVFQTFIIPMLPMWQAQGITVGAHELIELIARLGNLPELESIIVEGGIPIDQTDGANSTPKPSQTNRTYTRVNKPQSSQRSRESVIMQNLLGKKSQPGEAGKLMGAAG